MPFSTDAERVERYRDHAAKVRDIASDVPNPKTRAMLEGMAREWEQMADSVERLVIAIPAKKNGARKHAP
jgi:hypothetical protein